VSASCRSNAGDRPAAPLPDPALDRDEHRRPARVLDHARRDDPDHARVPPLSREHEAVGGVEVDPVHLAARLAERRAVDLLAAAVELLELAGDLERAVLVVGGEQLDAREAAPQPPDRVEARREDEADPAGGELPGVEPRRAHERAQAGVGRFGEELEAVAGEHAVLAAQGREVGDRRERDQVELAPHQRVLFA
jgi:hypothetical protein